MRMTRGNKMRGDSPEKGDSHSPGSACEDSDDQDETRRLRDRRRRLRAAHGLHVAVWLLPDIAGQRCMVCFE